MNHIIPQLLKLADDLDNKGCFDEANIVDDFIAKMRIKKKNDQAISTGYEPAKYDVVQQLQYI